MKMIWLFLLLNSCALTPSLSLTTEYRVDLRANANHGNIKVLHQSFSTSNPHLGTYVSIGFNYKF